MICNNCKKVDATLRLWCPTWISSQTGPLNLCVECAKVFQPEHNPFAKCGSWHWGEDADKGYKAVKENIPSSDKRHYTTLKVIQSSQDLECPRFPVYRTEDGRVWLVATYNLLCLGTEEEARQNFPALFS